MSASTSSSGDRAGPDPGGEHGLQRLSLLASILAQHRYLPHQLHNRGDRLAFSNGILALAVVAELLLWGFKANVAGLIHLYILGVFTAFTLSQLGMVRHWNSELRTERDPARRAAHGPGDQRIRLGRHRPGPGDRAGHQFTESVAAVLAAIVL